MTAPIDSERDTEPADHRPHAPVAAAVMVLAGFLVGAGALAASSVLSSDLVRLLIAVVLVAAGVLLARPASDRHHPVTLALGSPVLRGVGTSFAVLGAYLGGLALLTASVPDGPVLPGEDAGPSSVTVILLVYGVPALALLAAATTGMRAWTAGAGAILPMLVVLLMADAGAGATTVAVTMLVVGVLLAVLVVRAPAGAAWGNLASAAAAMATSFAFGTGTSPFGTLGATQLAGGTDTGPAGTPPAGALVAVLSVALLVAAVLLLVAVLRHDLAGGLLVGTIFAMPPVLLAGWLPPDTRWPAGVLVALAGVPALVALVAMVAIRVPRVRDALLAVLPGPGAAEPPTAEPAAVEETDTTVSERPDGTTEPGDGAGPPVRRPSGAIATAACAVVVAAAAVVFVVCAVPAFGWDQHVRGAVTLIALVAAAALGYWLPAGPGAAGSVVALLGLGLASPWELLILSSWSRDALTERIATGVLDLASAAALAFFLTRRHPRAGVFAAAAYALAGAAAAFLGLLLFDADHLAAGPTPFRGELGPVAIVALPLVLLSLAAVVAVFRGHLAVGQAVGAVALAAGGFVPLKVLVGQFAGGSVHGYALQYALNPLTPTDWLQTSSAFREVTGPALAAVLVMVALALVLAASLAARPSAPLAGAVALLFLAAVQSSLLTVLSSGTADDAELLGQVLGGVALLIAVVAGATAVTAARRR